MSLGTIRFLHNPRCPWMTSVRQMFSAPLTSLASSDARTIRERAQTDAAAPLALKMVAVSILLPDEVGAHILGLWVSAARALLLTLTPVLLIRFGQQITTGRYRFVLSDLVVLVTGLWMFVALGQIDGMQEALTHAGPDALELCCGYMAARLLLSKHGQAMSFVNFLCWIIAIVGLLGLLDTLTHHSFVHELIRPLLGGKLIAADDVRLGLLRATSTLEHPILYGITCSVGLLFAISLPIRGRGFTIFSCGLGTFLALSSAPIIGVVLGLALLAYNRMTAGIRLRWAVLIGVAILAIGTIFVVVDRPFALIFNHLVFNTEDAYYRMWVWQVAGTELGASPWFGLGFEFPDEIPHTIDSVWLFWALRYGIPGSLLLGLTILAAAVASARGSRVHLTTAELKLKTTLGILLSIIVFLGFTVDFFGTAWILIPLLIGVRAHLAALGRAGVNR